MKYFKNFIKKPTGGLKILSMTSMATLLASCSFELNIDRRYEYFGTDGDDVMDGTKNAELETFFSSLGADKMTAKSPAVVDYSKSNAAVTINLDGTVGKGGHAEGDILSGIEGVIGSDFDDVISGGGSYLGVYGRGGDDIIMGTKDYDLFFGDAGDDKLYGYDGGDYLAGGSGADILDGGAGNDTAVYKDSTVGVTINLLTGAASGGDAQGDILVSIENVDGSGFNDHITGDDADNTKNGYDGDDQIFGLAGNDDLSGWAGDDLISGGDGNDRIYGGQGDDILNGGAGDDGFYESYGPR
ncbi:MAG: hypothetical protein COC24_006220 [Alphaproteobacteria bacterium]|nr:hypothetical protein [Alphaproteobacteria bacterium]